MLHLEEQITAIEKTLTQKAQDDHACQRLLTIPGVGLLSATALVAAVGDVSVFKNGREMAAWLGLVPRQHSTGGKPTLLGISKRGDTYLRTLMIHGGRSIVRCSDKHNDKRNRWLSTLKQRRGNNIATVAAANKNARIAWAILTQQSRYQRDHSGVTA